MARRLAYQRSPISNAQLEPVTSVLYDSLACTNATTGENRFFQDAVGSNGKTALLTNMEKAGSLATPKLFDIRGVYLTVNQSLSTFTAALTDAVPNDAPAEKTAVLGLLYSTWFTLRVGEKDYIKHPTFLLPSNYRMAGGQVGGGIVVGSEVRTMFANSIGMGFSVARRRIRLLPDQSFSAALNFPITSGIPSSGLVVHAVLDGVLFREVQ